MYLETCPPINKITNEDGTVEETEEQEFEKVFEDGKTYIHMELTLTNPITPNVPNKEEPGLAEIIPVK